MTRILAVLILATLAAFSASGNVSAIEYKEYKVKRLYQEYFTIFYDKTDLEITVYNDEIETIATFPRSHLKASGGIVVVDDEVLFDELGLLIDQQHYFYDSIVDTRINQVEEGISITFYSRKETESTASRFRRGNLVSVGNNVVIDSGGFVRGMVLTVGANIEIYGEVNKDVIAILGDIFMAPHAVARGDVATVYGATDISSDASIYGEVYDIDDRRVGRRHRFTRWDTEWQTLEDLRYDRVDGLGLYFGAKYSDPDSLLPTFYVQIGYGFNSERWRYLAGAEQTVLRDPSISVGGALYRRLATEDERIVGDWENTTFALLATEDFRDYYEAEGGTFYVKSAPMEHLALEMGYRVEETKWLPARRHLWSLFGGSKLFSENFNTVPDDFRSIGIQEIDTSTIGLIYSKADWDTRDRIDPFDRSAWHASTEFEWSHDNLNSDFDYRRYTVALRRYQKVHRRAMIISRAVFGGSDGYLPMHKRFFLGGLGTLRGYDHKEFMGTRFWMANAEYRFKFPRFESAVSIFWDIGQIANDQKLSGEVDVKNNIGLALYIEDDFKVSLAKRLDRSYDDNPIFYVRFDHIF